MAIVPAPSGGTARTRRRPPRTPARSAMAMPSPVASSGLVVTANSWPAPPVASSTWRGPHLDAAPLGAGDRTPTQRPSSTIRSSAKVFSSTGPRWRGTASTRARSISAPVAAPPAWTTRARRWPPSRASSSWPCSSRSNIAPRAISSLTRPGPSSTSTRTASTSHSPAPAASVSARWRSVESGSSPSTAATRPGPTGWWPGAARPW